MMKPVLKLTDDGSHTLYVPSLDEHYHSHFGAITESKHIFINAGLASIRNNNISILEAGFGTGLNALLTALYAQENKINVTYIALDNYPLDPSLLLQMNYGTLTGTRGDKLFRAIHSAPWETLVQLTQWFALGKKVCDITAVVPDGFFDLVYFDAFSPDKQPEMWSGAVISRIVAVMHAGSVLVTYSAKGEFKRTLRALGLEVTLLPGPPGKRVMTRAVKK
jgi:tRNA U34 5-methylaminomethyl-2-thiouridine-forming methyltransferase MnmC